MKAEKYCPCCNAKSYETIEQEITFRDNNNIIVIATATRYDDAFYEITKGKFKGNLVHIFDVIKT